MRIEHKHINSAKILSDLERIKYRIKYRYITLALDNAYSFFLKYHFYYKLHLCPCVIFAFIRIRLHPPEFYDTISIRGYAFHSLYEKIKA